MCWHKEKYDGSKKKFESFAKLMRSTLLTVMEMAVFDIATKWDTGTPAIRAPIKIHNLFDTNKVTKEKIKKHSNIVYGQTLSMVY